LSYIERFSIIYQPKNGRDVVEGLTTKTSFSNNYILVESKLVQVFKFKRLLFYKPNLIMIATLERCKISQNDSKKISYKYENNFNQQNILLMSEACLFHKI